MSRAVERAAGAAEERLSRREITRETVAEILGRAGADQPLAGQAVDAVDAAGPAPRRSRHAGGSAVGVLTVPPWRPGLARSVLSSSYRDLLEVLVDAGRPLRAGRIAVGSSSRLARQCTYAVMLPFRRPDAEWPGG